MSIEFKPWGKIARLNRDIVITEKLDGTNAAVGVVRYPGNTISSHLQEPENVCAIVIQNDDTYYVYAQSRTRLITPTQDNHGFARWVADNAEPLVISLGEGLHFGEWWGSGIQRGYGLTKGEKRFSLFNTIRYNDAEKFNLALLKDIGVDTVPVLYEGLFDQVQIKKALLDLRDYGSVAAPGYVNPEGIIVFHVASQTPYKITIEGDEKPKGSTN